MTEPIDQATKDRIAWIADTSSSTPWESQRMKIFGERIAKEIATVWAEKLKQQQDQATIQAIDALTKQIAELMERLKQERNKAIDDVIDLLNGLRKNGTFRLKEIYEGLESLKTP